ncbi:MAG: Fur family transcriptional regulator [Opitutales bacterium]
MMNKVLEKFESFCAKSGIKKTSQRLLVFEYLYENKMHPSVEDVLEAVRQKSPMISTDSVYRILNDFSKAGFIKKLDNSNLIRYDSNVEPHAHIICRNCGQVTDVSNIKLEDFKELSLYEDISITINAICKKCLPSLEKAKA